MEPLAARFLEKFELPNRLMVELYDRSRCIAADRWFVGLTVRVPVEVTREDFLALEGDEALFSEFVTKEGPVLLFEMARERNFVDGAEKDAVLAELIDQVKASMLDYLGHENFARGVLRQRIRDFVQRRTWWK